MNINLLKDQTKKFATACYDMNSIAELQAPHQPADADHYDCLEWKITPDQWSEAIESSLRDKQSENTDTDSQ